MRTGVLQRLLISIFAGLFVAMSLIGAYRYVREKQQIMIDTRAQGEESGRLLAEIAAPLLVSFDYAALQSVAQNFLLTPNAQELVVTDSGGRELVRVTRPAPHSGRIVLGPVPAGGQPDQARELRVAVYPADLASRLKAYALQASSSRTPSSFLILVVILTASVSRSATGPVRELRGALKEAIDRKDFTRRVHAARRDEIGELGAGVNYLNGLNNSSSTWARSRCDHLAEPARGCGGLCADPGEIPRPSQRPWQVRFRTFRQCPPRSGPSRTVLKACRFRRKRRHRRSSR